MHRVPGKVVGGLPHRRLLFGKATLFPSQEKPVHAACRNVVPAVGTRSLANITRDELFGEAIVALDQRKQ